MPPQDKSEYIFLLYRSSKPFTSERSEGVELVKTLQWSILTFDDPPCTGTFWYALKVRDVAGNESKLSKRIKATVDLTPPEPPKDLKVIQLDTGVVKLSWNPSNSSDLGYYNVYISNSPIIDIHTARAMNRGITWNEIYGTPEEDGIYYFAVTSVDKSLNESAPSENVKLTYEALEPYVEYVKILNANGWLKKGKYQVELKTNQPLREIPHLSWVDSAEKEYPIQLYGEGELFKGVFEIKNQAEKTAYFKFSGYDKAGNQGTKILVGEYFVVDYTPPAPPRNLSIGKDLHKTR
jgi:hypothetical protein